MIYFSTLFIIIFSIISLADPGEKIPIKHAKIPYMEYSDIKEPMQRDYRLLKEGMAAQLDNFKAHFSAVLFISTPGYRRYKFVAYLNEDEEIVPIQYIDWKRVPPTLSHRSLDFYVNGKLNLFCLEPQNGVPLYTFDGRFYRDTDGLLRAVANHLPVMGKDDGYIYLKTNDPNVDEKGNFFENDEKVAELKIASFKSPKGLWTIEGTIFYPRDPELIEPIDYDYQVLQGYFEEGNEPPGMMTSPTIVPFGEGMAKSAKTYLDTYELLFQAVSEN